MEYLTEEVTTPQPEVWTFAGLNVAGVKTCSPRTACPPRRSPPPSSPPSSAEKNSGTMLMPSVDFLLSLDAAARAKLYLALAGMGVNLYFDYPYIFPVRQPGIHLRRPAAESR